MIECKPTPHVFGWATANTLQRTNRLRVGDMKTESDESMWIWVGENWERVEAPSANG